jgi:hypothetical protein
VACSLMLGESLVFGWSLSLVDHSRISEFHVRSVLAKDICPLFTSAVMPSFWN